MIVEGLAYLVHDGAIFIETVSIDSEELKKPAESLLMKFDARRWKLVPYEEDQ